MATNKVNEGETIKAAVPSGVVSGDPVLIGTAPGIPGVALTDRDADGNAIVNTEGVFTLSAAAIDSSGNAGADANVACAIGHNIYFDVTKTPHLSKRAGGTLYAKALGAITAGATAAIDMKLVP